MIWLKEVIRDNSISKLEYNKKLHNTAYELLKIAVEESLNIDFSSLIIKKTSYEKPFFINMPSLYFNLSHCEGLVACTLDIYNVGIDIENIRPYKSHFINKILSCNEQILLKEKISNDFEKSNELFFRFWTLKESYIKAIGKGLSYPLSQISFSFDKNNNIISNKKDYKFTQWTIKNKYILSLCQFNAGNETNWEDVKWIY